MTTDNFVCKTAKIFAVLFLAVLFVTAFTTVNCAWADGIWGTGEGPGNTPGTGPAIPGFGGDEGGEGGDITITPGSGPTATGPTLDHDDPNSLGSYGFVITDDGLTYDDGSSWWPTTVGFEQIFSNTQIIENGQFKNNIVVGLTPGNTVTFNKSVALPEEIEGWAEGYVEPGNVYIFHGSLAIADGKTITTPCLTFGTECDGYYFDEPFNYDSDSVSPVNFPNFPLRSISGEFHVDQIRLDSFFGNPVEDCILFCANGGNIIFDTKNPDNAGEIDLNSGFSNVIIPTLKDTKITLNKPLVVNNYGEPIKLTLASEPDVTLKVCCEAENSISAESVFISSGRVDIKGVLEATLEVGEGATFSPGNSIETTTVDGNFTLDPGAILLLEIGGENAEDNDQLVLTGENSTATYSEGSTIKVVLDPSSGFEPEYYQEIYVNIPKAEEIDWDKVNFSSDMFYVVRAEDNVLVLSRVVPEPSTWALLVLGAAGLLYLRKKNA